MLSVSCSSFCLGNFCLSFEYAGLSPLSKFLPLQMPVMDNIFTFLCLLYLLVAGY